LEEQECLKNKMIHALVMKEKGQNKRRNNCSVKSRGGYQQQQNLVGMIRKFLPTNGGFNHYACFWKNKNRYTI
jgi:hypothetical protein